MSSLELVVVLGGRCWCAVRSRGGCGSRRRCCSLSGVLLGFVPALRQVQLPPEAVLLLFLPVLLYWESLTTSLREIRSNLRVIVLMSTLLVVARPAPWPSPRTRSGCRGAGLGARRGAWHRPTPPRSACWPAALPRRTLTTLRAESLVNDGTALVVYGLAVGVTVGEDHLSVLNVSGRFLLSYGAAALAGLATAWVSQVRQRLDDPLLENLVVLLTPFTAFLLAEAVHASGVLAVVVCGLIMSQVGAARRPRRHPPADDAFWSLATFLLNGALFVLVGMEAQSAARGLTSVDVTRGAARRRRDLAPSSSARGSSGCSPRPTSSGRWTAGRSSGLRRVGARGRIVSGVAGFRGAVSLALALAVPATTSSGAPFPGRDLIVFVTAGVMAVTLLQGLLLPRVVRWARLPQDTSVDEERRLAATSPRRGGAGSAARRRLPTWAPPTRSPSNCAPNTTGGCGCSAPAPASRTTAPPAGRSSTRICAWR